jgi:hypothetical protein
MRVTDILIVSVWSATIFGILEGILLNVARAYPPMLAPYKASAHLLWIAPVEDVLLFLVAGIAIAVLIRLLRRWRPVPEFKLVYGFFVFLGIFTVAETPKIIHILSVLVLSFGASIAVSQRIGGYERRLTDTLRRWIIWIPIAIAVLALSVHSFQLLHELWQYRQLP